jgi:Reverse transcriptase (RNA-dependent DNA polymerase)
MNYIAQVRNPTNESNTLNDLNSIQQVFDQYYKDLLGMPS